MTNANNVYDNLYNNIKNRFTVDSGDGAEYTLGDYMLMKANAKKENANLPVAVMHRDMGAVTSIINYVSDKLTVKAPPVKDKTIKAFPFRTSLAALLSSVLMCTLVFAYGLVAFSSIAGDNANPTVEVENTEEDAEEDVVNK